MFSCCLAGNPRPFAREAVTSPSLPCVSLLFSVARCARLVGNLPCPFVPVNAMTHHVVVTRWSVASAFLAVDKVCRHAFVVVHLHLFQVARWSTPRAGQRVVRTWRASRLFFASVRTSSRNRRRLDWFRFTHRFSFRRCWARHVQATVELPSFGNRA